MFGKSLFKSYSGSLNLFSRISDPVIVVLAAYFSLWLKFDFSIPDVGVNYKLLILFVFLAVVSAFPLFNLYLSWRGQSLLKQAKAIFLAWSTVILAIIVLLFSLKLSAGYSRLWLGYWAVSGLMFLLLTRLIVYGFLQYQRSQGRNIRRVIVVGAGELGKRTVHQVNNSHWMGYEISAIFDDMDDLKGRYMEGCPIVGNLDDVSDYLFIHQIDEIWLALPLRAEMRMRGLLDSISHHAINIKLIPDIFSFTLLRHSMTEIAGMPAVNLSVSPMDGSNQIVKELEDRVLAFIILLLISPLLFFIAIGVKTSSPGPVFFKQERVSWNGRKFKMYKFRSMPVNDDKNSQWGNAQNKEMTKFGRFLRMTSLDELPQFINVIKGSMSIVGPRPERAEFVEKFKYEIPGYMQKHMVKAGITGWAQINGWRGDTCLKTRVEFDLFYIENWSLWFDLRIIFMTIYKGFIHKNAL